MKYTTLRELYRAYMAEDIPDGEVLWLDNDTASVYVGDSRLFEMHPEQILTEALDLLDIPWDHV